MDAGATPEPFPEAAVGSLEWMWMLPEVKARPSLAIEFVNCWRALPTTMNDKQRAAQAAKMMVAHGVKLSATTALAFKDHLALLFGDAAFEASATPSSHAAAGDAGGQSNGHGNSNGDWNVSMAIATMMMQRQ